MLQNPIYTGDFRLAREAATTAPTSRSSPTRRSTSVQAVLHAQAARSTIPKQRHAFMGLLTCARCGCAMTAERKKGKYVYYRCTGFKGACGNTYIREERLADLLGDVITPIQISPRDRRRHRRAPSMPGREAEQRRGDSAASSISVGGRSSAKLDRGLRRSTSRAEFRTSSGRGNRRSGRRSLRRVDAERGRARAAAAAA